MPQHWRAYTKHLAPLLVFASSRLVVILGLVFSAKFIPQNSPGAFWNTGPAWCRYLLRFDSGWYLRIAREGYSYDGNDLIQQPVVFYPLYPLLSKGLTVISGLPEYVSMLVISNLASFIAVLLIFKLIEGDHGSEVAYYAVALLSFFPTSLFLSAGYTESLALLLIAAFFHLLKRERFFMAAGVAGLAVATRSTGIILLLPLLYALWRRFAKDWKALLVNSVVCAMLTTSGLWLYMGYLSLAFHSPLVFMTGRHAWQVGQGLGSSLFKAVTLQPFRALSGLLRAGPNPVTLSPWFFLLFALLIMFFRKRLSASYGLFAAGVLLLPYLTLSESVGFWSFTRYILLAFPVFIILGSFAKQRLWFGLGLTVLFAGMLFWYTALFAQWYWAG